MESSKRKLSSATDSLGMDEQSTLDMLLSIAAWLLLFDAGNKEALEDGIRELLERGARINKPDHADPFA